jgi:hypothetical protein
MPCGPTLRTGLHARTAESGLDLRRVAQDRRIAPITAILKIMAVFGKLAAFGGSNFERVFGWMVLQQALIRPTDLSPFDATR